MAMTAGDYLELLKAVLDPLAIAHPQPVQDLRAAAEELDDAIAARTTPLIEAAASRFRARLDTVRRALVDKILEAVPLEEMKNQARSLGLQDPSGTRLPSKVHNRVGRRQRGDPGALGAHALRPGDTRYSRGGVGRALCDSIGLAVAKHVTPNTSRAFSKVSVA